MPSIILIFSSPQTLLSNKLPRACVCVVCGPLYLIRVVYLIKGHLHH